MKKRQSGFTMVEVIVTAVIIAVLAAVAIPIYAKYIDNQRQETVDNLANTGAASANSFYRRTGNDPTSDELDLFIPDSSRFTVSVSNGAVTVVDNEYEKKARASYR
jgi:prepilin-type N-terminal cleavage/methylation domain-containing protein